MFTLTRAGQEPGTDRHVFKMLKNLVHNWLLGGADLEVGLRLFLDYTNPNLNVARIISKKPERHFQAIRTALLKAAELPFDFSVITEPSVENNNTRALKENRFKLRGQWPFLADPECPPELKLLISDKITAFTKCGDLYGKLTDAKSKEEELGTVSSLVENFINNHEIYKELKHYSDYGRVLGKHVIFFQYQRIKDLRNLTTMDLFNKKKNLENNIWRTQSKIKKEKRADLLPGRELKLKELKMQLAEVNRLLE